jgi:hypothetical protein
MRGWVARGTASALKINVKTNTLSSDSAFSMT